MTMFIFMIKIKANNLPQIVSIIAMAKLTLNIIFDGNIFGFQ